MIHPSAKVVVFPWEKCEEEATRVWIISLARLGWAPSITLPHVLNIWVTTNNTRMTTKCLSLKCYTLIVNFQHMATVKITKIPVTWLSVPMTKDNQSIQSQPRHMQSLLKHLRFSIYVSMLYLTSTHYSVTLVHRSGDLHKTLANWMLLLSRFLGFHWGSEFFNQLALCAINEGLRPSPFLMRAIQLWLRT